MLHLKESVTKQSGKATEEQIPVAGEFEPLPTVTQEKPGETVPSPVARNTAFTGSSGAGPSLLALVIPYGCRV